MEYKVTNLFLCEIIWNNDVRNINKNKADIIIEQIKTSNFFLDTQLLSIKRKLVDSFLPQ